MMLVRHKGLSRTAAYRAHKNVSVLNKRVEEQREAFSAVFEKEKAAKGNGDMTDAETQKLQNEIWQTVQDEDVETLSLRKLPAEGLPWETLEAEVSSTLLKHDLVEGEVSGEST